MILENYIPNNQDEFIRKVRSVAKELNIMPEYLMAVMYFESRLDPRAQNGFSNATGLIQFMPDTARRLGTTTSKLLQMSNVEQMDYVLQYLKPYKDEMNDLADVYLAIFYPAAIGQPDYYPIGGQTLAEQNPIFNTDGDNQVRKSDVIEGLYANLPAQVTDFIKKKN